MNTNYKSNIVTKWRQILTAVCVSAFLLIGLPAANAQSGNLPILFFSEREGIICGKAAMVFLPSNLAWQPISLFRQLICLN